MKQDPLDPLAPKAIKGLLELQAQLARPVRREQLERMELPELQDLKVRRGQQVLKATQVRQAPKEIRVLPGSPVPQGHRDPRA